MSTAVGMAILGVDGAWEDINPALARLLGDTAAPSNRDGTRAGTLFDVLEASAAADLANSLPALLRGETASIDRRIACRRGDAVFDARINLGVLRDASGLANGLVLQLQEDPGTDDAAAHDMLRRDMQAQIDAVAHDLRAPLRSIGNFAGLLARNLDEGLDESSRDHLGRIRASAARMSRLLDGLSELSRATTAPLRPGLVDLTLLADWVAAEQQDAHPGREFRITVQDGLTGHGDERLLKTMLVQLLDNARRFSHEGAPVTVDVSGHVADGLLHVAVRDRGRGFDMRCRHKLFEPFQRLHGLDEGAGDGLGLAIAQRIAGRHGGRIDAESDADGGSVFHIQLPAARLAGVSPGESC